MSLKKLQKYIDNPLEAPGGASKKKAVILADSRGRYIKCVSDTYQGSSDILWVIKPGLKAIMAQRWLNQNIHSLTHSYGSLHFYFWFGTCDLTEKLDRQINISNNVEQSANDLLDIYANLNEICCHTNCTFTLLEIPYYSISIWNKGKLKIHDIPTTYTEQDVALKTQIDRINCRIKEINKNNGYQSPVFNADLEKSRKTKGKDVRYSTDLRMLQDGIHPNTLLSKAWIKSLMKIIYRDCY